MSIENIISLIAALGIGGALGAFLNSYFEQQKQTKEHDMRIFKESNEILSEGQLSDIVNFELLGDHAIDDSNYRMLKRWCLFFDEVGNQYLNKQLNNQSRKLFCNLTQLVGFIAHNFFTIKGQSPANTYQYLYPDLNIDRGGGVETMSQYEKYANELEELTNRVSVQYKKYRLALKQLLKV